MNRYDQDYFEPTYGSGGLRRYGSHWWANRWYARMADRCLEESGGRAVLEVGCGQGFLLAELAQRWEAHGIDISPWAIDVARRHAPAATCAVANIEQGIPPALAGRQFDLIVARYVLEHLADPAAGLRVLAELLRPGGMLFYAVPYTESLGARRKGDAWFASPAMDPTHCSLLARARWLELTRAAGLDIARESADGWWDVPYWGFLPAKLQLALLVGPTALACLSGRPLLPARWGENILVFARRPAAGA